MFHEYLIHINEALAPKASFLLIMGCLRMQVFPPGMDTDAVVLYAARASRTENQDAIDASIVGMLGDPKEVL